VGQWKAGGTQTGEAFDDILVGALPPGGGKKKRADCKIIYER